MGKLQDLKSSLDSFQLPRPVVVGAAPVDATQEALAAIVSAISALEMPETELEVDTQSIVEAIKGLSFPEFPAMDMSPVVEAIKKVKMTVNVPEPKAVEPTPYTFTIVRDENGIMTSVLAVPGIEAKKAKVSGNTYE